MENEFTPKHILNRIYDGSAIGIKLISNEIPDGLAVPVKNIGEVDISAYYNNVVIMPDVSTTLPAGQTGSPSSAIDISSGKYIGVFADLKESVANEDLIWEVSYDGSTWYVLETKNFTSPSSRYNYFVLGSGLPVLANYIRVTPKNNGGSAITLPYINLIIKG